jgi:hypothetical protein
MNSYYSFGAVADTPLSAWDCLVKCYKAFEGWTAADLAKQTGVAEGLLSKMVNALAVGGEAAAAQEFAIAYDVDAVAVQKRAEFQTLVKSLDDGLAKCNCTTTVKPAPTPTPAPTPAPTPTPTAPIMLDPVTWQQLRERAAAQAEAAGSIMFRRIRGIATPETRAAAAVKEDKAKAIPIIAIGALAALMLLR